jgi:hypothetical protein
LSGNQNIARLLGYSGLIPFISFSIASWFTLPFDIDAIAILIAYAAIILSFMGAIHWGIAMSLAGENRSKYFVASILPALVAWCSLLLAQSYALIILLTGFTLLIAFDVSSEKAQRFPHWYLPMRIRLTTIVLICLFSALASSYR